MTAEEQEIERLNGLLREAGARETRIQMLQPVIENVAWMKKKLDDGRSVIKSAQIVISYDNGGGQKGIRENPMFKGYEALWKSYMAGMGRILDSLPPEQAEVKEKEVKSAANVLELVRAKHA